MLRRHCDAVGRNCDDIEKTIIRRMDIAAGANNVVQELGEYAALGITHCLGHLNRVENIAPLQIVGRDVMPQLKAMWRASTVATQTRAWNDSSAGLGSLRASTPKARSQKNQRAGPHAMLLTGTSLCRSTR